MLFSRRYFDQRIRLINTLLSDESPIGAPGTITTSKGSFTATRLNCFSVILLMLHADSTNAASSMEANLIFEIVFMFMCYAFLNEDLYCLFKQKSLRDYRRLFKELYN